MGIKHTYPATGSNDGTKQVSVTRWNDDHTIDSEVILPVMATPSPPAAGKVSVFGRSVAGRSMLAQIGPAGLNSILQPFLARNKVGYWCPPGNAVTLPGVFGLTAPTAVGTATARNVATTNLATRMRRLGFPTSAATAGLFFGIRLGVAQFTCGSGVSDDGSGITHVHRFVESDPAPVAGRRVFAGLSSSITAMTNVEQDTLLNQVGIVQLSSDATQWYWHAAGSSAGTAVACGTGVGAPGGNSTTAWELSIFCPSSVAAIYYLQLTNLTTGVSVSTTYSGAAAVVPQSTTLLAFRHNGTNNATALAAGTDICSIYVETDT